jgi:hypothetical protein
MADQASNLLRVVKRFGIVLGVGLLAAVGGLPAGESRSGEAVRAVVRFHGDPVGDAARGRALRSELSGRLSSARLERVRSGGDVGVAREQEGLRDSALGLVRAAGRRAPAMNSDLQRSIVATGARIVEVDPISNSLQVVSSLDALSDIGRLHAVREVAISPSERPLGLVHSTASVGAPAFWEAGFLGGTGANDVASPDAKGSADLAIINDDPEQDHPAFAGLEFQTPQYTPGGTSTTCGQNISGCEHGTEVTSMAVSGGAVGCIQCVPADAEEKGVAPGVDTVLDATPLFANPAAWALGFETDDGERSEPGASDPAEVVNNSHGNVATADDDETLRNADRLVSQFGVTYVLPAGNEGPGQTVNASCIAYNTICTGAFLMNNSTGPEDDTVAEFSSRGPSPGGRKKPDLVAVGGSTVANQHWLRDCENAVPNCLWEFNTGTSLAAPQVAGAAALLAGSGISDPLAQKAILVSSTRLGRATPTADMGTQTTWQPDWGWGALDLGRALQQRTNFHTAEVGGRQVRFYRSTVEAAGERATLVWNRRNTGCLGAGCGDANSTDFTLSNLDLLMHDEDSGQLLASSTSTIDNVEQVRAPAAGDVVYVVRASSDVQGPEPGYEEPFALAARRQVFPLDAPEPVLTFGAVPPWVKLNQEVTLTTTVENGSADLSAEDVAAHLDLPPGVELGQGSSPETVTLGDLAPAGTAGSTATVTWTVRGTADGIRKLSVRASSTRYEETMTTRASLDLRIDGAPPELILRGPAGLRDDPSIPLSWVVADTGSGLSEGAVEVSTDGGAFTALREAKTSGSATIAGERGRQYLFRLRARDRAGNESTVTNPPLTIKPAPPPPPPSPPDPFERVAPGLELLRTTLGKRTLAARGFVGAGVSGRVQLTFVARARGRTRRLKRSVALGGRRFAFKVTLPKSLRSVRRGRLTIVYPGSSTHLPEAATVTVRRR